MTYTPSITYSFQLCFIVKVILSIVGTCSLRLWDCRNSCYNQHRSMWRLTARCWCVAPWKHNLLYQSFNIWIWNLNNYNVGFFYHLFNIYLSHLNHDNVFQYTVLRTLIHELELLNMILYQEDFTVCCPVYFQSTFRPNRGNVTGYFLAGKTMHWIPVGNIPAVVVLELKQ
jgi:hypothetical protein